MSKTKWDLWLEKNHQPEEINVEEVRNTPKPVRPWDMLQRWLQMSFRKRDTLSVKPAQNS